jgi:hypothetical protein
MRSSIAPNAAVVVALRQNQMMTKRRSLGTNALWTVFILDDWHFGLLEKGDLC